jgi:hypothetical protein
MRFPIYAILILLGMAQYNPVPHAQYRKHGPALLPDPSVTPGDTVSVTKEQLCSRNFHTVSVRHVTAPEKMLACAEYQVKQCDGSVEIDHLISLELGGSNDIKNLWPQPYEPAPGAREKTS